MRHHFQGVVLLIAMVLALWAVVRAAGPVLDDALTGEDKALQAESRDVDDLPGPDDEIPLATEEVLELQAALIEAGYDPGPIDGQVGPGTREAAALARADRGLDSSVGDRALLEWLQAEALGLDPTAPTVPPVDIDALTEIVEENPVAVGN